MCLFPTIYLLASVRLIIRDLSPQLRDVHLQSIVRLTECEDLTFQLIKIVLVL